MPGRIYRLFRRNSQGGHRRRSVFAGFFNKYFKCCFTVERSEVNGDFKPSPHLVWIKVPPHIRVILLRIMYGIAVDPAVPRAAIDYCDAQPQFDILIRQYARALVLLDGSYFEDSSIAVVVDWEPDHLAALNLIRRCFSMNVINCVPALKQPIVVEGQFVNSMPKRGDGVLTRSVQKALADNKDKLIDTKLSFASISMWHHTQLVSLSTTKSFHLENGGFSSMTKTLEPRVVRVNTLKTVEYNINGNINLKTHFLPSIELPTPLTAKNSEIKALSLFDQPLLTTPCMQSGEQNQCRDIYRSYSTVLPRDGTIQPFTLTICCDINNTFKVSFKCFQDAFDIIFDGEQARSILEVIARMLIYFVGGNFQNGFENRCVMGFERNATSGTMCHLIPFVKAMYGLLNWINFRNQQLLFTPAIMAPQLDEEHQPVLTTDTTSYSSTDSTKTSNQSCQRSVGSSLHGSSSINAVTDVPAIAHHAENAILPKGHSPELIFICTDDFEGGNLSLGAPLSGECQKLLCLSNSYHDLGQGSGKFPSASLSPLKAPEDVILPDYLLKLDNILPNKLQIISKEDLCPVVLSGTQVQLGKGANGEVLLKRLHHSDGPLVAEKSCYVLSQGEKSKKFIDEFRVNIEARVLMFLSNESRVFPYVYGICEKVKIRKSIVIEYVGHPTRFKSVTLFKAITFKDPNLSISDGLHVARDIAEGVQVMQKHGLIHNDLASRNILLYHDGKRWAAKITDFGSICHASTPFDFFKLNNTPAAQRQQCIAAYREYAPELHFPNSPPTFASDIHSLGNMFREMGSHLRMRTLYKLGKLCTRVDPQRRPLIDDLVNMLTNKINNL